MKRSAPALLFILIAFALTLATGPNAPRLLCRDTGVVFAEPLGGEGYCFCCPGEEVDNAFISANGGQVASNNQSALFNEPCCAIVQQDTKQGASVIVPSINAPTFAILAPASFTTCPAFLAASASYVAFRPTAPRAPPLRNAALRGPPYLV